MGKLITVGMANRTSLYNYIKPDETNNDLYNSTKYWIGDSYNYIGPGCFSVSTANAWHSDCVSYSWTIVNISAGGLGDPNSDSKLLIAPYSSGYRMGRDLNYTGEVVRAGVIGNYGYFPVFLKGANNAWGRQQISFHSLNYNNKVYLGSINMIYLPALNCEIYNAKNSNNNGGTGQNWLSGCHKCFFDSLMCVPLSYYELGEAKQDVWKFSNSACTIHNAQYNDAWFHVVYYHGYIKNVTDNKVFYFKDFMIINSYKNNFTPRTFGKNSYGWLNDGQGAPANLRGGGPYAVDIDSFVNSLCGKTIEFSVTFDLVQEGDTDYRNSIQMRPMAVQHTFNTVTMPDALNTHNVVNFNYTSVIGGYGTRLMYFNWIFIVYKELSCEITLYVDNNYYYQSGGNLKPYGNMTVNKIVTTSTGDVTLYISGFYYLASFNLNIKRITYRYIGTGSLGFVAGTYNLNTNWYVGGNSNNMTNHPRTIVHTNNGRNVYLEVQCHA